MPQIGGQGKSSPLSPPAGGRKGHSFLRTASTQVDAQPQAQQRRVQSPESQECQHDPMVYLAPLAPLAPLKRPARYQKPGRSVPIDTMYEALKERVASGKLIVRTTHKGRSNRILFLLGASAGPQTPRPGTKPRGAPQNTAGSATGGVSALLRRPRSPRIG